MDIYKENGITKIKWQTEKDGIVRGGEGADFSHVALDDVSALIKTGFNNGEKIMFPLDPQASAANIINCRCFVTSQA